VTPCRVLASPRELLGTVTATDNCGSVTVTSNAPASSRGNQRRDLDGTDGSGKHHNLSATGNCSRHQVPVITSCPAMWTVNAMQGLGLATGVTLGTVAATDNCGSVTVTSNAPAQFPVGTNTLTWTVSDGSGNTTTCQQRVIVRDIQVPVITSLSCGCDSERQCRSCFATELLWGPCCHR